MYNPSIVFIRPAQPARNSMERRPIIFSLTGMHDSGLRLLREAGELRMASALDPATLQREVVGADALIIRTGGVIDAALLDRGKDLKVVGRHDGYVSESGMVRIVADINASGAAILFLALGSPRQELWIARYLSQTHVRLCQGTTPWRYDCKRRTR